ncbi:beta-hexosaminidase [Dyella solisilvae]|uniref:beta-N-acetylhexosaminidase n=1 Tax=Dyella solisilvae TaxID=1920168 RepID=A0A370K843_9GAMM|nr:family 20 glycosylhydrolase [Dyella solisilvae]RDI98803.1 beta-hexosaminidase [Dyella solisilvae]
MSRIALSGFFCRLAIAWLVATGVAVAAPAVPQWSLLPQPVKASPVGSGAVEIADGAVVSVHGADRQEVQAVAERFVQRVADTNGMHLRVATADAAHAAITFDVNPNADVVDDAGYRITVDHGGIVVTARTPRGAFYGSVTLWQLLTPPGWTRGAPVQVADGVIDDHPRFAWRALLLDSGRHFQSVADIKKLIDWMSLNKLNVLLWHITEDQGWRLEIPKYPELTKVGACRKAVGLDSELTGSPDQPYCGFYTQTEAREIVRYAAERFVDVVPEIDLPGHSQAAIAAYPWLGVTGKRPAVWTDWGVSPWLIKPDEKTLQFVDDVLDEVMQLFPSRYISIGGDEADKQQWNASPEVRAQMHKLGLANMDQLQGWFMNQVAAHLVEHGRTPVGWDDVLVAGAKLPASQVVMSWHGDDNERVALAALRQGHDVVMTPQESLYFDHYQSDLPDEWPGPPPAPTLRQAYDTVVIPDGASADEARRVIGVQAGLWAEQMPTFAHDQHAVFPRIAALSELGWSPATARDWNDFLQRMPAELARYRALGIDYADSAFAPAFHVTAADHGAFRIELSNQVSFGTIRYTTDGSLPTSQSDAYAKPLTLSANTTLRAATFAANGFELAAPRTQVLDENTLLGRDGSALATCSRQPATRLDGSRPPQGPRPIYSVDIGNACWLWPKAPLDGITHVAMTVERMTWRFGDEAKDAVVRRKASAAGEFEIHADSCTGPLLASLPLDNAVQARGQVRLDGKVAMPVGAGVRDLCVFATGDPRDGQWALARMVFSK